MASKSGKFGAFAGVFTPSILTILGVIMYLRLGWVVGQAGFYQTLGIILLAHIISIATGLSIASISTDKKVKTGGIYYMLSRSLGLPMGGAIGITLFIGTALSISLYIIGFAENFLGVESISNFLGVSGDINTIRITGTAVIILLSIIAWISTSLAIKTQFIILGAIALSIISIVAGIFHGQVSPPEAPLLTGTPNAMPLEILFAIFFPAVTGFTAGVAMSGDLKDPQRSIPKGTMFAIGTGFIIYIGLAWLFAFRVPREMLLNDKNFLLQISMWMPLVLAGIWGATLSSALGGILGAPRILQATSMDKVTPAVFARGKGADNEPRNALILTFVLAEAGILIGELDVIARIVSMFYIAAYGFINLSFALEKWASSDFRPSLNISKWVGIIGFIASFMVMFKIDTVAMFLAFLIMFTLYFLLKKRKMALDFGDVWQSVRVMIMRNFLNKMDAKGIEERNWKPNIILFSGGTKSRPHLLRFGKWLVGSHGLLSNFDLTEDKSNTLLFSRPQQSLTDQDTTEGVFIRRQAVRDIYEGIENIAQTYGFSGVEPNTVLMGWGRHSSDPNRFVKMLHVINELDMNIMLMDYDKKRGFGKKEVIDMWWRGGGQNANLMFALVRFLWLTDDWRNTRLRIMVINSENDEKDRIFRTLTNILDNLRIKAEIKIINNEIEKKPVQEIILTESINADLILLGIAQLDEKSQNQAYVDHINKLCQDLGTVLLVHASSFFQPLQIDFTPPVESSDENRSTHIIERGLPEIHYPARPVLATHIDSLLHEIDSVIERFRKRFLVSTFEHTDNFVAMLTDISITTLNSLALRLEQADSENHLRIIINHQNIYTARVRKIIGEISENIIPVQQLKLEEGIRFILSEIDNRIQAAPEIILLEYTRDDMKPHEQDKPALRRFKQRMRTRIKLTRKSVKYPLQYRRFLDSLAPSELSRTIYEMLDEWGMISMQNMRDLQTFFTDYSKLLRSLQHETVKGTLDIHTLPNRIKTMQRQLDDIKKENHENMLLLYHHMVVNAHKLVQQIAHELEYPDANRYVEARTENIRIKEGIHKKLLQIPSQWRRNQLLIYNATILTLQLHSFIHRMRRITYDINTGLKEITEQAVIKKLDGLSQRLDITIQNIQTGNRPTFNWHTEYGDHLLQLRALMDGNLRKMRLAASIFSGSMELMEEETYSQLKSKQFKEVETIRIAVARLVDYVIVREFIEPIQKLTEEMPLKLNTALEAARDIQRLISFSLDHNDTERDYPEALQKEHLSLLTEQQNRLALRRSELSDYLRQVLLRINERESTLDDQLTLSRLMHHAQHQRQYVREQEFLGKTHRFKKIAKQWQHFYEHRINELWYRQSKGIILANRLKAIDNQNEVRLRDIHELLEKVSPLPQVSAQLPYYYRQLFMRRQFYLSDFFIGREKEIQLATAAFDRYSNGYAGGIMVLGEYNSGKSFFVHHIARQFNHNGNIHMVTPPPAGSASIDLLHRSLQHTLESNQPIDSIMEALPDHSIIILDDMELWWEKAPGGMESIHEITRLIEQHSHRILFITTINKHAFKVINNLNKIESLFLSLIELQPFNAEELKEIIMMRHRSTDMHFILGNKTQDRFTAWDYARLFVKYFNYSQGNAGVALNAWISNITNIDEHTLNIRWPKTPEMSRLNFLEPSWYLLLLQFILHKRLTPERLVRITQQEKEQLINQLHTLVRAGIIEGNQGYYQLNPFLQPLLINKLTENEML